MEWKFTKHTGPAQHGWRCSVAGVHYVVISGLDDGASILSTHGSVYLGPLHFASAQDARIYAEAHARGETDPSVTQDALTQGLNT